MLNVPAEITSTMPDDIFLDGEIWYSNCHSPNKTTNNYCMLGSGDSFDPDHEIFLTTEQ